MPVTSPLYRFETPVGLNRRSFGDATQSWTVRTAAAICFLAGASMTTISPAASSGLEIAPGGHLTFYMPIGVDSTPHDVGVRLDVMNGSRRIFSVDMAPGESSPQLQMGSSNSRSWRENYADLQQETHGAQSHLASQQRSERQGRYTRTRQTRSAGTSNARRTYLALLNKYRSSRSATQRRELYPRLIAAYETARQARN